MPAFAGESAGTDSSGSDSSAADFAGTGGETETAPPLVLLEPVVRLSAVLEHDSLAVVLPVVAARCVFARVIPVCVLGMVGVRLQFILLLLVARLAAPFVGDVYLSWGRDFGLWCILFVIGCAPLVE
jgi:hypothetical protein